MNKLKYRLISKFSRESKPLLFRVTHFEGKCKISVEPVWGKRKAVGRKHRVCFEPINFEIEVAQEGAVRLGRRAFL